VASPQRQVWTIYHGEDRNLDLLGPEGEDPTGFALAFTCSLFPQGPAVLTISSPTITVSGPDEDDKYTIRIPFTRAQTGVTLARDQYAADLWRTDTGTQLRLAGGQLVLDPPVRAQS
jgi:hypothetical protein